jgi:hypothetical protein
MSPHNAVAHVLFYVPANSSVKHSFVTIELGAHERIPFGIWSQTAAHDNTVEARQVGMFRLATVEA